MRKPLRKILFSIGDVMRIAATSRDLYALGSDGTVWVWKWIGDSDKGEWAKLPEIPQEKNTKEEPKKHDRCEIYEPPLVKGEKL